jgi:uncharacterized protein (TIGR03067 family)
MTRCLLPFATLFLLGAAQNDAAKKDLESLQGTWLIHAMEVNGADVPAARLGSAVLTVKGDRYEVKVKDRVTNIFVLTLDPAKSPKEIDMLALEGGNKDKVHKGIYKIEGGMFIFCRGLNAEQQRPNQFATWPDTNYFVITWKKQN